MIFLEWLVWLTVVGLVWIAFCATNLPSLLSRLNYRHHGGTR